MNQGGKVVVFTLTASFLFFVFSIYISYSKSSALSLDKISIISDIVKEQPVLAKVQADGLPEDTTGLFVDSISAIDTLSDAGTFTVLTDSNPPQRHLVQKGLSGAIDSSIKPAFVGDRSFSNYLLSKTITNFNKDTSKPALPTLMQKLIALKNGRRDKVRIAWFGDSMIEGDLLTKTFRKRIQQAFGGYGVGFVPATSVTSQFRNTIVHKWKGTWKEESFKTDNLTQPLYLSGHTFFTNNGELMLTDKTIPDTSQMLEKSLICGPAEGGQLSVRVNGASMHFQANRKVNRLLLDTTCSHKVEVGIDNIKLPVYGLSIEPKKGVVVDNFSFRGITGLELAKLDSTLLRTLETENNYDLVILEYGANLMFRPDDKDYSWYRRHIINVVAKLQQAMPNTEFLVISTADRAFRYDNTWKTAVGIDNLIKTQAEMAFKNDAAFYNMYQSMGGSGTIVHWAEESPPLANKDYIHPNFQGADVLGNMLFDAFMNDFRKATKVYNRSF